jgi:hypothetical protein
MADGIARSGMKIEKSRVNVPLRPSVTLSRNSKKPNAAMATKT